MRAGKLRYQITIQSPGTTQDAYGQETGNPVTVTTAMADVYQMSGRELWYAKQIQPQATHRVVMRYQAGITPEMFVVFQGRTLNIVDVNDVDGLHRELDLVCTERK